MRTTLTCLQRCFCGFAFFMLMGLQCAIQHDDRSSAAYTDIVHVSPLQKTYRTGDTIWFSYNNPAHKFTRKDNGRQLVLDTLSFPVTLTVYGGYNSPKDNAADYCEFLTGFGPDAGLNVGNFSMGVTLNYGCNTGGSYNFKTGIRLKKAGIYVISVAGGLFSNCPERTLQIDYASVDFTLDAGDGNPEILQSVPDSLKGSDTSLEYQIGIQQAMAIRVQ